MHRREESSRVASLASPSLCGLDRPGRQAGRERPFLSPAPLPESFGGLCVGIPTFPDVDTQWGSSTVKSSGWFQ